MAGERVHVPGRTEISAVCSDPAYRRYSLGFRLRLRTNIVIAVQP